MPLILRGLSPYLPLPSAGSYCLCCCWSHLRPLLLLLYFLYNKVGEISLRWICGKEWLLSASAGFSFSCRCYLLPSTVTTGITGDLSRYWHHHTTPYFPIGKAGKSYGGEESQWNRRSLICMSHQVAVPSAGAISDTTAISPPYPYTIVWDEFVNIFTPPKSQTVRSKERK